MKPFGIAIHGGAGTILKTKMTGKKAKVYQQTLQRAYTAGYVILEKKGSALEAVQEAITILEDSPLFNAGRGSVFNHDGQIAMDAALMDGKKLKAGAIAGVPNIKNPIRMAAHIMKHSNHILLSGEGALAYAKHHGLALEPQSYFETEDRYQQYQKALAKDEFLLDHDPSTDEKFGTVGAVALDRKGNLAAGTSTGGMVNKKYGRIGDSPLIGVGTYAHNDSCAISCTGHGEYFMRTVVAHEVAARMRYGKQTLEEAAQQVIQEVLPKIGGRGGLIGMDTKGNLVLCFNSRGMYRGFKHSNGTEFVGIFKEEESFRP